MLQQTQATLAIELLAVALQHLANLHRTAGLYGVAGGLFRHVFRQQRFGGPQMQVGQPVRLVATQLALQKEREQRMVGIPLAQAVQRLHEQSDAFELFEHAASVAALGQAIGQRRVEALQQAGRLQEVEGRRTERFHHLLAHVVANAGMTELQVFQKQIHPAPGLHFLHRQLQGARPPADAPVEALDLLAVDGHRQRKVEQRLHLFRLESQVRRVHRQQLMLDPQVRHAQFRQAAAAHQQRHPGRHVAQEEAQRADDFGAAQYLEIIQHQQQRLVFDRQLRQQMGQQRVEDFGALLRQQQAARAAVLQLRIDHMQQVTGELTRIVVARMQLQPGDTPVERPGPLAGQGRLAETAGRPQ